MLSGAGSEGFGELAPGPSPAGMLESSPQGCVDGVSWSKLAKARKRHKTTSTCRSLSIPVDREPTTNLKHLFLHFRNFRIGVARFQRIQNVAHPMRQLDTLSLAETARSNRRRTDTQT